MIVWSVFPSPCIQPSIEVQQAAVEGGREGGREAGSPGPGLSADKGSWFSPAQGLGEPPLTISSARKALMPWSKRDTSHLSPSSW